MQPQLKSLSSLKPARYETPEYVGCNRQLPISQAIVTGLKEMHDRHVECRHCNVSFSADEYVSHLENQHDDRDSPLQCFKYGKGFPISDLSKLFQDIYIYISFIPALNVLRLSRTRHV